MLKNILRIYKIEIDIIKSFIFVFIVIFFFVNFIVK